MPKGRPRKAGPREPNGRLARNRTDLPPCMEQEGLAMSADDFTEREVTDKAQVVGRAFKRRGPLDAVEIGPGRHQLDGDEWKALAEYEARHHACTVSVKNPLDRTPSSGNGLEGVMSWLLPAIKRRDLLRRAMPPHLWAHLEAVIEERAAPDVSKLRQAARCLLVVLDRPRRVA